jgi:hypothetical protein
LPSWKASCASAAQTARSTTAGGNRRQHRGQGSRRQAAEQDGEQVEGEDQVAAPQKAVVQDVVDHRGEVLGAGQPRAVGRDEGVADAEHGGADQDHAAGEAAGREPAVEQIDEGMGLDGAVRAVVVDRPAQGGVARQDAPAEDQALAQTQRQLVAPEPAVKPGHLDRQGGVIGLGEGKRRRLVAQAAVGLEHYGDVGRGRRSGGDGRRRRQNARRAQGGPGRGAARGLHHAVGGAGERGRHTLDVRFGRRDGEGEGHHHVARGGDGLGERPVAVLGTGRAVAGGALLRQQQIEGNDPGTVGGERLDGPGQVVA